jgi:3-oxoacyl-[acyl-carrier-protein] synthase-3
MGTRIEALGVARPLWRRRPSSVGLAVAAARRALRRAGRRPEEVAVLVNSGLYVDDNVGEPANAAFIQRRLGAGGRDLAAGAPRTLSFDLTNGGCGVLSAVQAVDALVGARGLPLGLVVASDVPSHGPGEPFPFSAAGGALVLAPGSAEDGFVGFHFETFPEYSDLLSSLVKWRLPTRRGPLQRARPQNLLAVAEKADYAGKCVECAADTLPGFLRTVGLDAAEVDLLVPSQHPLGFPSLLARRLDVDPRRVAAGGVRRGIPYTAGPLLGLASAAADGRLGRARNTLFVTVGSGLNVGLALYRGRIGA